MDEGYTEHSGCPVTKGEKWITTVWMREGVTAEEPSTLYDPQGVLILQDTSTDDDAADDAAAATAHEEL